MAFCRHLLHLQTQIFICSLMLGMIQDSQKDNHHQAVKWATELQIVPSWPETECFIYVCMCLYICDVYIFIFVEWTEMVGHGSLLPQINVR